jgi:hypothetical protein
MMCKITFRKEVTKVGFYASDFAFPLAPNPLFMTDENGFWGTIVDGDGCCFLLFLTRSPFLLIVSISVVLVFF